MARASHRKRWPGFGPGCRFHLSKASKFASSDLLQIINIFCLFHHFPILLRAKRAGFEFSSRFVFENIAGFFSRGENRCDFFNSLVEFAFLVISSHLIQRVFFCCVWFIWYSRGIECVWISQERWKIMTKDLCRFVFLFCGWKTSAPFLFSV